MGIRKLKTRKGFTLIEVTLFLALTVALFFPLIVGTSTNISRQRYQDAVNDVYSYLQNAYSEVENIVNANTGGDRTTCTIASDIAAAESRSRLASSNPQDLSFARSKCAIYGKIFFFLPMQDSTYGTSGTTTHSIVSYDVLGDILNYDNHDGTYKTVKKANRSGASFEQNEDIFEGITDIASALRAVHADYLTCENGQIVPAGATTYHTFEWGSSLETVSPDHVPFQGALLIVRSPLSGAINSLFINTDGVGNSNNIVSVMGSIYGGGSYGCNTGSGSVANRASLYDYLTSNSDPKFKTDEEKAINLCVASPDMFAYGGGSSSRRNIQVNTAVPASSRDVKLLNQDDGENQCQ